MSHIPQKWPLPKGQRLLEYLNRNAAVLRDSRIRFTRRTFLMGVGASAALASIPWSLKLALAASGITLNIVAHEDDDLLFLSPDLLHDIQAGRLVRTIYVTAGDAGNGTSYWQGREAGEKAAYSYMGGVSNAWTQTDAGITGHPIPIYTLNNAPAISVAFMHLPDGNFNGSGFSADGNESLQKLWQGNISTIHTIDGTSSYTKTTLLSTLTALMNAYKPDTIRTQDYVGSYGDGDHSDHHTVAYMVQNAQQQYTTAHTFTGYQDYATSNLPQNVFDPDLTNKQNAFYAYGADDPETCFSASTCAGTNYALWLPRQYTVSGTGTNQPPIANAGANQSVSTGALVTLDGSGSSDPDGNPLTYQWTQTSGPAVTLSSSTAVAPTFTAPSSATSLTFQLVVNDGQLNSSPATVTITVTDGVNHAPVANAGANQVVGFGFVVRLDGSGSSDPDGNPLTYQWTQTSGPAVTLSSSTAVAPTFTAPSSATSLTFQLVVNDGQLNSSPATVTITVAQNVAPLATATASSQNTSTGQTANKAIDGVIDGYPGDYTKEWATSGGGAGSWLKLTWTTAQTVTAITLYDRPNLNDQILGGNIQFSDGSSITIGALNNNGSATSFSFTSRTITSLQFNITAVSSTTQNVGLAEIQVFAANGGGGGDQPPIANAGANRTVNVGATVTLDGSGSSDPDGNPLTYQWTQTSGPAVTLSSSTAVAPTFTAPSSATSLTFQLVVNDGQLNSSPATVTITVAQNVAPLATATASSQNTSTGQTANKAIDGVIDGYPGDYTKEWATSGGGAGSWLKLTWTTAQTVTAITLYDRPNLNDQILGGNIQFSDGSSITIGALNNNGSATSFSFTSRTITSLQFNITAVSSTTQNVGLAEIQVFGS